MKLYSLSQVEQMSPCTKPNDRFYGTINLKYKPSLTFKKPFFVQHRHSFIEYSWFSIERTARLIIVMLLNIRLLGNMDFYGY